MEHSLVYLYFISVFISLIFPFFFNILPKQTGVTSVIIHIFICRYVDLTKDLCCDKKCLSPDATSLNCLEINLWKSLGQFFFCIQCIKILVQCLTGTIRSVMDILNIVTFSKISGGILWSSLLLIFITYCLCVYVFFLFTKSSGIFSI